MELELCQAPTAVVIDASQLEMAVLNLAVNSRDAMPNGGTLRIVTSGRRHAEGDESELPPGDYVVLTVTDNGDGIPPQLLSKVFDPFFTTKPVGSGTARQSGGTAFVRSEIGKGTTVEMHFPVAPADAAEQRETLDAPVHRKAAHAHSILVVEDDADVRRVIVECLGLIGYSVTEAPNGTTGLAAMAQARPDLLVVDYAMPDMTGAEVISKAREMWTDLPVILATGYADMAAVERLAGKPAILRKLFDITTLGDAVAGALEGQSDRSRVAASA